MDAMTNARVRCEHETDEQRRGLARGVLQRKVNWVDAPHMVLGDEEVGSAAVSPTSSVLVDLTAVLACRWEGGG